MDFNGGLFSSSMDSSDTALARETIAEAEEAEDHEMRCLTTMMEPEKVAPLLSSDSQSLFSDGAQMLRFSSASKQEELMLTLDGTLPCYHHPSASTSTVPHLRNAGSYSGSFDENMHRVLARVRGPFTPSQWLELERQALIYKCIVANAAIPPSLLIAMRRGLGPAGFPPFSAGYFGSTPLGWGQGYAGGNDDPEPGRCRRTDGKKWRCSRDAVADQKYCERHMNRGRHRSRKHVEGRRTGHAVKALPAASQSAPTVSGGGNSGNVITSLHETESLQTADYPAQFDRIEISKGNANEVTQDAEDLSMLGSLNSRPMGTFPISNEHNLFEDASSRIELGHISMDSPLKPPCCSFPDNIITTPKFNDQHFIDEWPKNQFEVEEMQFDRTQLSISIPASCSDFVSSSSSIPDGLMSSPFRSSQEYNIINMDPGHGVPTEASRGQTSWAPVSWESSMAGPLGEVVLSNARHTATEQRKNLLSSSINFLTDGCDLTGWLESSPTGVLQKASFRSVSSSTGSSPRAENHEKNSSPCEDILGSAIVSLPTIPS